MPSPAAAAAIRHHPTRSRTRRRWTALALGIAATMGAGCSGAGASDRSADTGRTAETARSTATVAAPPARREFDACALAPQADVQAALAQAGVSSAVAKAGGSGGQCSYRSSDGVASLLLEVTDFQTIERAQQLLDRHRTMAADRKYPIQDATGIGDQGAISDEGETSGLKARKGTVVVTANLKLRNSTPAQRHAAVEALGRKLIAQLPSL